MLEANSCKKKSTKPNLKPLVNILAEGAIALSVTLSGGALFASWKLLQFLSSLNVKFILAIFMRASAQQFQDYLVMQFFVHLDCTNWRFFAKNLKDAFATFHGWSSQRSLHDAPIFRLLLKVAVNGTHQCDFLNFCGPFGVQQCFTLKSGSAALTKKNSSSAQDCGQMIFFQREKYVEVHTRRARRFGCPQGKSNFIWSPPQAQKIFCTASRPCREEGPPTVLEYSWGTVIFGLCRGWVSSPGPSRLLVWRPTRDPQS